MNIGQKVTNINYKIVYCDYCQEWENEPMFNLV